jgi:hypothetical protein
VSVQPLAVLFAFPVLIGIAAQLLFGDARKAACAATLGTTLVVAGCLAAGDPGGTWNWLATLLVLPLPIALSLAAVVLCHGRSHVRHKHHR